MRRLFGLLVVGSVVLLLCATGMGVVILVGLGAGYSLNRLVPGIDLGSATVIGVLAFLAFAFAALQFLQLGLRLPAAPELGDEEDVDDDFMSDDQVEYVADRVADALLDKLNPHGKRGRKSRAWSKQG
jgi:hypothetical protein